MYMVLEFRAENYTPARPQRTCASKQAKESKAPDEAIISSKLYLVTEPDRLLSRPKLGSRR